MIRTPNRPWLAATLALWAAMASAAANEERSKAGFPAWFAGAPENQAYCTISTAKHIEYLAPYLGLASSLAFMTCRNHEFLQAGMR